MTAKQLIDVLAGSPVPAGLIEDPDKEVMVNVPGYDALVTLDSVVFHTTNYFKFRVFAPAEEEIE